jgi:DNA-binding NarL/FixJ family response regulator
MDLATSPIRILLIDDHELFLAGLQSLLRNESGLLVVGTARNRKEAVHEAQRGQPHVILLDLDLGSESGLDCLPDLLKSAEGAKILVVTGGSDPELHLRAVCMGALGVVLKVESPNTLVKAIRKIHAGEAWMNRRLMASAMTQLQGGKADPDDVRIASLTAREREVISSLGEGRRNKEIAERLFISEKTVRHYLTSIFSKLEVDDRLELMIFAYRHGLARVPSRQSSVVQY